MDELLKKLQAIQDKRASILKADALTAEQQAEVASLRQQAADLRARIKEQQELDAETAELAELQASAVAAKELADRAIKPKKKTAAGVPAEPEKPEFAGVPATIRRHGTPKAFTVGSVSERQDKAYRFGMFGMALLSMHVPGRYRNADAEMWLEKHMAVHQSNNATGSHVLIPEEFSNDMIVLRERFGVARRVLKVRPMQSDTLVVPRRASGLTAYFVAEGSAGTESNKTWNDVRLTAKDLMVISRWSGQVNSDAVINFGDDLASEITYAFSSKEDDCAFNGDGTSTYGGITGLRSAITVTGTAGIITQASGNTWSAITLADFQNVVGLLPQYADTPSAAWLAHRTFYYGVMQKLELAAGGATAMEVSQGDRRPRPLFLGYPVEFTQKFPSATAVATVPVMLGDFSLAGSFGDRQQEGIAFSDSAVVGGESTFERNQLAIRGIQRFDIVNHDVGTSAVVGPVVALKTGA